MSHGDVPNQLSTQRPMKKMRGFLKGVDTDVPREDDRA